MQAFKATASASNALFRPLRFVDFALGGEGTTCGGEHNSCVHP